MAAGVVVAGDSVGDAPFPTPEPTASTVARGDGTSSRPLPRLNAPPHDYVRHAYSPRAGPLWSSVAAFLGWTEELARGLITFGGVYYKPGGAPALAKPKRELDPDREVEIGEYLRIFPEPRRYPAFLGVDWESKIVYDCAGVMLVNKPAGVPAHATVDNFAENMLAGIRSVRPDLDLLLPHRLDIDTSGLVIVVTRNLGVQELGLARNRTKHAGRAKGAGTLRSINEIIKRPGLILRTGIDSPRDRRRKNKALRRAAKLTNGTANIKTPVYQEASMTAATAASAAAAESEALPETSQVGRAIPPTQAFATGAGGGGGAAAAETGAVENAVGAITKRYRALVQVLPGRSPLKASPIPMTHFQKVSRRAPKEFRRDRPPQPNATSNARSADTPGGGEDDEGSWIECRLLVLSASEASVSPVVTSAGFPSRTGGSIKGGIGDGGVSTGMLQEVEVQLLTGRTHQIRGQLAAEGCPIYGDYLYGPAEESVRQPGLQAGFQRDENDSRSGFVESPKMALQASHISLELEAEDGRRERHVFTLARDTCWWFDEGWGACVSDE
ncbi:putative RNA pseudouridylate synthase [Ectocarpus siliculosus]|uniref:RNA pseudouridylate synthase n=1 Tax=Ectocarpus siliculosus TaxID=2880 RepID=D7G4K2_ECTSI|nr:putative RNA pseudouridylate synthase [Ectocarpus siliculosus]|eukprot:CBJ48905.1 putative RNA pseudouridylate synthase [Ectocarpus siliculosus]